MNNQNKENADLSSTTSSSSEHSTTPKSNASSITSPSFDGFNDQPTATSNTPPKEKYKQKSHSYHDLHSDYSKKRYGHVKSKVKEYIANIRAHDRLMKGTKFIRHRSMPETIGHFSVTDYDEITNNPINDSSKPSGDYVRLLREKDREVEELRKLNENLESNLHEKITTMARLKMNADMMRFELFKMQQQQHQRHSLPSESLLYSAHRLSLSNGLIPNSVVSTATATRTTAATQTELKDVITSEKLEDMIIPDNSLRFYDTSFFDTDINLMPKDQDKRYVEKESLSIETKQENRLRRRSNSLQPESRAGDSNAVTIIESDSRQSNDTQDIKLIDLSDDLAERKKRKRRYKKKSTWQFIKGPCKRAFFCCRKNCGDGDNNDFFYTQLPVNEFEMQQEN